MSHEIWTQTTPRSDDESYEEAEDEEDLVVHLSTDPTTHVPGAAVHDVNTLHIGRAPTPKKKRGPPRDETLPPRTAGKWASGSAITPLRRDNRRPALPARSKTDVHPIKPRVVVPHRVAMRQTLPTNLTSAYDIDTIQTEELSLVGDATGIPLHHGQNASKTKLASSTSAKLPRQPSAHMSIYSDQSSSCPPPTKMTVNVETKGRLGQTYGQTYGQTISHTIGETQGQGYSTGEFLADIQERGRPQTHPAERLAANRRCDACTVETARQQPKKSPRSSDADANSERSGHSDERQAKEDKDHKPFYEPLQLLRSGTEVSQMYHVTQPGDTPTDPRSAREQVSLHTVSLPRRGLIKLTGLPYEMADPSYYDDRRERPPPAKSWEHTKFSRRHPTTDHPATHDWCCTA